MEYIPHVLAFGSLMIAVLSLLRSGRKEQTELDKEQDNKLAESNTRLSVLEAQQNELKQRVAKSEGKLEAFDSNIAQQLRAMESRMDNKLKNLTDNLTNLITSLLK